MERVDAVRVEVTAYDKADIGFIEVLKGGPEIRVNHVATCKPDLNAVSILEEAELVFCHIQEDAWSKLRTQSSKDKVRVRLSTEGLLETREETHKGAFFLTIVPPVSKSQGFPFEVLPEIVNYLSDLENVRKLVRDGECRNDLRRLFFVTRTDHVAALYILCQGYLAAYASNRPVESKQVPESIAMVVDKCGKILNGKDIDVCTPKWWVRVFEGNGSGDGHKRLREELKALGAERLPGYNSVIELCRQIFSPDGGDIAFDVVAGAHACLIKALKVAG